MNVSYVAVLGDFRKRGAGSALIRHAIESCRTTGADVLLAEIRESNTAGRALFLKNGFTETAVLKSAADTLLNRGPRIVARLPLQPAQEVIIDGSS